MSRSWLFHSWFNTRSCVLCVAIALSGLMATGSIGQQAKVAPKDASNATKERESPPIFQLVTLLEKEKKDVQWERLFDLVAAIQKEVEAKAGELPYKDKKEMVSVAAHRKLPMAKKGLHSRWSETRHVSKTPPGPGGTYIHTAVAVMPNSLSNQVARNIELPSREQMRTEAFDGYLNKSIVVVDGTILTTSYIYHSIVIAAGPIKIEGYINNSLVISVGSRGPSLVDVEQGYLSNCLVIGERVAAGYVHESLVYGKLKSESLRGADVRDHADVARIPWKSGPVEGEGGKK